MDDNALIRRIHAVDEVSFLSAVYSDKGHSCIAKSDKDKHICRKADIIIPAYNVEKYITQCVNSALKQRTKYPYRIIIIDDGSTDSTPQLVDRYKDFTNVLIIHQKNKGLSGARNAGLAESDAEYLIFLDSDDCLPCNALEKSVDEAERTKADIVCGSYYNFLGTKLIHKTHRQKEGIISINAMRGHAWVKLYKRALFDGIYFPEGYWYEDSVIHQIIAPRANKIWGISDILYQRRNNPQSITHISRGNVKSMDSLWVTLRLYADREKLGMAITQEYYDYILSQVVLTNHRIQLLGNEVQANTFAVFSKLFQADMQNFATKDHKFEKIQTALRSGDYELFREAVQSR